MAITYVADDNVLRLRRVQSGRPGHEVQDNRISVSTAAKHFTAGCTLILTHVKNSCDIVFSYSLHSRTGCEVVGACHSG